MEINDFDENSRKFDEDVRFAPPGRYGYALLARERRGALAQHRLRARDRGVRRIRQRPAPLRGHEPARRASPVKNGRPWE